MFKNKLFVTNNSSVLKNLLLAFFAFILVENVALAQATFSVASGSSATGCAPLTVNFTGTCPGCTNFVITGWSATPGSINSPTATLTFPNASTYSVTMSYTINGVPGTTTQPNFVTAYPNPVVDFSTPNTTICQGQVACFTPNITSGTAPFTYNWVAGQSSSAANPCITYNTPGAYTVSLTVTDTHGCTGTKSVPSYLTVPIPPDATFTTTYTAGQCNPPVIASFLWTGTPQSATYTHSWDFGSAPTSTASGNPAVNHTYNTVGVYDVTHIVTNAGCSDTVTVPGAVVVGINPIPAIIINDTTPCKNDQINAQCPTGGFTYAWTSTAGLVGTSGPPTNFSATITCNNTGNQTITCTMTQAVTGCTTTVVKNIFVDPGPQFVIVADDTVDCAPPFTVKFHLEDAAGNCLSNLQPSWLNPTPVTFIPGTCPQYQYTYTTAGNFDVSVLATNSSGCSSAITQTNYIHIESPIADFTPTQLDPVLICAGQSVQFTDMSIPVTGAPIISWAWTFATGAGPTISPSSLPNPIKIFPAAPGLNSYNVTVILTITDANGCTSTKTYATCVKVGMPLSFSVMDFIQVGGNTNLCGTQTISYQASVALTTPPFPPGVNILWQYYNPNSTPPYTSLPYSTGLNGIMTFNPDSLGPFCVRMVVNNNGCKDTMFKCNQFTMSGPIAKFSSSPDINCSLPALYTFADTSIGLSGAALNNMWKIYDMNNGGTLITPPVTNQPTYSYNFTTATLIKVVLVRTEGGCTDSISKFINITETRADFTASDTSICIGNTIGFTPDIQTGLNYAWYFGIGGASNAMSPFYTYPLPGSYTAMLAVEGNGGACKDTVYQTILVNGSKINITANDTIACFPAPASLLQGNLQTVYPAGTTVATWSWGFSDLGTANGQNVNHLFTTANYNYAYLYTIDTNGCTSNDTLRFVMPDPQADFTSPTTTSCAGKPLLFASTSVGINNSTLSYIWNYGDGGPNTVPSPQDTSYHTYITNGNYDVTLIISDIYGCKDTTISTGYINITPFIADYTVSDTFKSCPTLNVLCTPSSVSGHLIDTTTLQWILYDNPPPASISYITSQYSPTIPVTVPGLYTLSLVLESTTGCKDTVQKNNLIRVLGPKTDFTVTPPKACPGATISLQAINGTPDIISYSWLLTGGNATNSTSQNASVTYNTPGVYFPIVVINNGVCTVTMPAADSVIIVNPPIANFTISDTIVCVPDNIQFTDTSVPGDGAINAWNWDLGLGTSTIKNPSQNYAVVGVYPITLIVTDANGCKDTTSKNVSAIQNLQPNPVAILRTSVVNNNQIAVRFAPYNNVNNDFGQYLLYRSAGGVPTLIASISNIANTTYLDNSVSASNNCYEYSLKVENGCGNISNFSATSSASCLSSTPLSGAIKITWTPYLGWTAVNKYNVYRVYDYDTTTHVLLGSVSGSAVNLTYTDSISIRCLDPISYRVEAIQTGTGVNAWSDTTICAPFNASVNAQVHVKVATVENNAIKVTWDTPQNVRYLQEYYVEKDTTFGGNFYPIGTAIPATSTLEFIDTDVNVARRPYTYRITGKDSCNNFLQSGRTGTSMVLIATPIASRIRLNWTPYTFWKNGVLKYRIQLFNSNVPEWVTIDSVAGNVLTYEDEEIRFALPQNCYRIVAVENQGGKSISMSNESCGALEPVIYTPTAFTPNGDNVNDFYLIKGTFVITYHIRIYNNSGQMVYESNDLNKGWDGKINGTDCPEGTYVYHVEITSLTGEKKQKAGSITLIR